LGTTDCGADNEHKVLGLSANTNAHAEVTGGTIYTEDVCFERLDSCEVIATDNCLQGKIGIVSLSGDTNAHLGPFSGTGSYPTKICCGAKEAHWEDDNGVIEGTTPLSIVLGTTTVKVVGNNLGLSGQTVTITIWDDDGIFNPNDEVSTIPNVAIGAGGKISRDWTITSEYLDKTGETNPELFAVLTLPENAGEIKTNEWTIGVAGEAPVCESEQILCSAYTTEADCTSHSSCGETGLQGVNCGEITPIPGEDSASCYQKTQCYCGWDSTTGICKHEFQDRIIDQGCPVRTVETPISAGNSVAGGIGDTFVTNGKISATETGTYSSNVAGTITHPDGTTEQIPANTEFTLNPGDTYIPIGEATITFVTPSEFVTELGGTFVTESSYPNSLGKCSIQETTEDNCEDGFLTYSWKSLWNWADNAYPVKERIPGYNTDNTLSFITDPENPPTYHFPTDKYAKCTDKTQTIPCPAQIQLPFFNWINFVIALVVIALIYLLFFYKKKLRHHKSKLKK
jgi:hypothetical protein